jgi:oleate hydratase
VRRLLKWLDERGVVFEMNTTVTDRSIVDVEGSKTVEQIVVKRDGLIGEIAVRLIDRVLVTLGSMTK